MIEQEQRQLHARLAAVEAVTVQLTARLLNNLSPGLGEELVCGIREALIASTEGDDFAIAIEGHLARLAADIEARIKRALKH